MVGFQIPIVSLNYWGPVITKLIIKDWHKSPRELSDGYQLIFNLAVMYSLVDLFVILLYVTFVWSELPWIMTLVHWRPFYGDQTNIINRPNFWSWPENQISQIRDKSHVSKYQTLLVFRSFLLNKQTPLINSCNRQWLNWFKVSELRPRDQAQRRWQPL